MIDTILCLINFYKNKNCINSKNIFFIVLNIILGITLNIATLLSFNILKLEINKNNKILSGYFIIISIFYVLSTVKEKISNLKCIKDLFVLPISYEELFFSIFSYHFLSYTNILYMHLYFIPIYFLYKSFSNFIILLLISLLIGIFVELITLILCELLISMLYSTLFTFLSILTVTPIIYVIYLYYNNIIESFSNIYIFSPHILLLILLILLILLYKISKYLFFIYELLLKKYDN